MYGHRRIRAYRTLGLEAIPAEVGDFTNEESIQKSLIENVMRENLSDYEKAVTFQRMNEDFGKSYVEIAALLGYSKTHICNYFRMLKLF